MRYSVRGVWNTERDRAIAEELCHPDYSVRRRGRGPRNGPREWQSIPQSRASTLTYYFTPKTPQYCSGVASYLTAKGERRYYKYQYQPMTYFEMVGRDEATGKPRVRHLPNNRGEYDRERIPEA